MNEHKKPQGIGNLPKFKPTATSNSLLSSRIDPDQAKSRIKKTLFWVSVFILVAPVVCIVFIFIMLFIAHSSKMDKLNNHAKGLEKELSSLVFIQGRSINAKGGFSGDALTASSDPRSTFAEGSLRVDESLASLESEISTNLRKSGFVHESSRDIPYYVTDAESFINKRIYDSIMFRYVKGDKAIRVVYRLNGLYTCPKDYICEHTPESKLTDNIYPVANFGSLIVMKVEISFSYEDNWYRTGYNL